MLTQNKTRKKTESIRCELTPEEYTQRSERMVAQMHQAKEKRLEIAQAKEVAKAAIKALREELNDIEAEVSQLGVILHERHELRDVECRVETDLEAGVRRTIRIDTGELVSERPLEGRELQAQLVDVEDADADSAPHEPFDEDEEGKV